MKKVIDTTGYGVGGGAAAQITLPNGKFAYVGAGSKAALIAMEKKWEVKIVEYFGACMALSINERAHLGFPIQIGEVSVADFIDKIATEKEWSKFLDQIIKYKKQQSKLAH